MNKRLETIRSLFKGEAEPAAQLPTRARVAAGVVHSIKDTFSAIEQENESLRAQMTAGEVIFEVDPFLIDASFAKDRMSPFDAEGADAAFVSTIREQGQLVPVLLRRNPSAEGRFQPAYGRRRIAAAAFLKRKVRALVRELSDEELVVAQGQENEARNALTFIERCRFAATLESQKFSRKVIEAALGANKSHVSEMLQIATDLPASIVDWIGPAPEVGRPRWLALTALFRDAKAKKAALLAVSEKKFPDGNKLRDRFSYILAAAASKQPSPRSVAWTLPGQKKAYGSLALSPHKVTLTIDRRANPALAGFVLEKLEEFRRALERAALSSTNQEN